MKQCTKGGGMIAQVFFVRQLRQSVTFICAELEVLLPTNTRKVPDQESRELTVYTV